MNPRMQSRFMKNRKCQAGMSDLFLAASIFMILMVSIIFAFSHYSGKLESRREFNAMQMSAFQISEILVKSAGIPYDWENESVNASAIGLSYPESPRNISSLKTDALMNMTNQSAREILSAGYDFHFVLKDTSGNIIAEKGPNTTQEQSVRIERRVVYKGKPALLSLRLWRD